MAEKTIPQLQSLEEIELDHLIVVDTGTQTFKAEVQKLFDLIAATTPAPTRINPFVTVLTSGSGTWLRKYAFVGTGISATVGATYTHNAITYTVAQTVASGTVVYMTGSGAPLATGTLTKAGGTGDPTIIFTQVKTPNYLDVEAVGGGGGGAGGGDGGDGTDGGNTTFGSSLITCNGGLRGRAGNGSLSAGGSSAVAAPAIGTFIYGSDGAPGWFDNDATSPIAGGNGGSSPFGGGGSAGNSGVAARSAAANSGSGGGGGGGSNSTTSGGGGSSGGWAKAKVFDPDASYAYAIGAGGPGAAAGGVDGTAGGNGAAGLIIVEEHFL